jgi:hypothetical protein
MQKSLCVEVTQLVECLIEDQEVAGSIPARDTNLWMCMQVVKATGL